MQTSKALNSEKPGWLGRLREKQNALLCIIDQGIVSVAGLATSVLIGRSSSAELGLYYMGLTIVLFMRGIQQQMICIPYTIYQQEFQSSRLDQYRGSCVSQYLGLMVLGLLFIGGQALFALAGWTPEILPVLFVLMALMPVVLLKEFVRHYCFTHLRNFSALSIDFAISALQVVALVVLGYVGVLGGATAWAVIGVASLLVVLFWHFRMGPGVAFDKKSVKADWTKNWSFGKWAVGGQIIGSLPTYLLPFLLLKAVGEEGTGLFAAAMTLVGLANIFNMGMTNYITPQATIVYAQKGKTGLRKILFEVAGVFLVTLGGLVLLISWCGDWLVETVYGSEFIGLKTVMILLAVGKLFESFTIVTSTGLFVLEKIKANFVVDVILMVITLAVAICLIPMYGVLGAALTAAISALVSSFLRAIALSRYLFSNTSDAEVAK